jgi:hypothetical protein
MAAQRKPDILKVYITSTFTVEDRAKKETSRSRQ